MLKRVIKSSTAVLIIPLAKISEICTLDQKAVGTPTID